jgi:hypothetical protein
MSNLLQPAQAEVVQGQPSTYLASWAQILQHLLNAEMLTFQEELSLQRSESTTGVKKGYSFCVVIGKILLCKKIKE